MELTLQQLQQHSLTRSTTEGLNVPRNRKWSRTAEKQYVLSHLSSHKCSLLTDKKSVKVKAKRIMKRPSKESSNAFLATEPSIHHFIGPQPHWVCISAAFMASTGSAVFRFPYKKSYSKVIITREEWPAEWCFLSGHKESLNDQLDFSWTLS